MVQGRCMGCKTKRDMKNAKINQTARGGFMAKGQCSKCNTNMAAILSKDGAENAIKDGAEKAF